MYITPEQHATLQPGSEVMLDGALREAPVLVRVKKILPSGRITLEGDGYRSMVFDPNGRLRGGDRWYRKNIRMPTPELREQARRAKALIYLDRRAACGWQIFSNDGLEAIIAVVKQHLPNELTPN